MTLFLHAVIETGPRLAEELDNIARAIASGKTEGPNWEVSE